MLVIQYRTMLVNNWPLNYGEFFSSERKSNYVKRSLSEYPHEKVQLLPNCSLQCSGEVP